MITFKRTALPVLVILVAGTVYAASGHVRPTNEVFTDTARRAALPAGPSLVMNSGVEAYVGMTALADSIIDWNDLAPFTVRSPQCCYLMGTTWNATVKAMPRSTKTIVPIIATITGSTDPVNRVDLAINRYFSVQTVTVQFSSPVRAVGLPMHDDFRRGWSIGLQALDNMGNVIGTVSVTGYDQSGLNIPDIFACAIADSPSIWGFRVFVGPQSYQGFDVGQIIIQE